MRGESIALEPADESALSYVETLLEGNDLPSADVRSKSDCFYVGFDGDRRIGIGGLERCGSDALLRSLVVEESVRGAGYGAAICDALEREARADGVEALYLLTTTAAGFFADRGYVEIDRTDAPTGVRETTEFADLCPTTATCLRKSLASRS